MSAARASTMSDIAPTPPDIAPTHDWVSQHCWTLSAPLPLNGIVSLSEVDGDAPYDNWAAAQLERPRSGTGGESCDIEADPAPPERRHSGLYRCKRCKSIYNGHQQCTLTSECDGEIERVYEDELMDDPQAFAAYVDAADEAADEDQGGEPYDIEAVPASPERRHSGLYRCKGCKGVFGIYSGNMRCALTSRCDGEVERVYEDELEAADEDLGKEHDPSHFDFPVKEEDNAARGDSPSGLRYCASRDKYILASMRSSSHEADDDFTREPDECSVCGEDNPGYCWCTGPGMEYDDEEQLRAAGKRHKRSMQAPATETPASSPKRPRTDPGDTRVFVPETPPREQCEARVVDLERQVRALQKRVQELQAGEANYKKVVSALGDLVRELRRKNDQQ